MLPIEKRRERKDRLLKLAERERQTVWHMLPTYGPSNPVMDRIIRLRLMRAYQFELAAWQAFGAPL